MTTPISPDPRSPFFSRREMLKTLSSGFGYLAFAGLAARAAAADDRRHSRGAARAEGAAFRAAGEARHLPLHARRAVARRYLRLQAQAHGRHRRARDTSRHQAARLEMEVCAARTGRALDFRALPECRESCRRPLPAALDADRPARASAGVPANAHRLVPVRPAVARRLDALWPRQRKRKPPRLRHADAAGGFRRCAELWLFVSPRDLSRHTHRRR